MVGVCFLRCVPRRFQIYDYTCTGTFERHKLMFSFQMCTMIMEVCATWNGRLQLVSHPGFVCYVSPQATAPPQKTAADMPCSAICRAPHLAVLRSVPARVTRVVQGEDDLNRVELDFFLKGDVALEGASRPCPFEWVSAQGWKDLLKLETISPEFESIVSDFEGNVDAWKVRAVRCNQLTVGCWLPSVCLRASRC